MENFYRLSTESAFARPIDFRQWEAASLLLQPCQARINNITTVEEPFMETNCRLNNTTKGSKKSLKSLCLATPNRTSERALMNMFPPPAPFILSGSPPPTYILRRCEIWLFSIISYLICDNMREICVKESQASTGEARMRCEINWLVY